MSSQSNFALGYAHPSTIVMVDDNESFLKDLESNISYGTLYQPFTVPERALEYFNDFGGADESLIHRAIDFHGRFGEDALLRVKMAELDDAILNKGRFNLPTVLITDYAMPSMNGLELCKEINDPSVKKILLTGEADAQVGIEAFNAGTIDRFVTKGGAAVREVLDAAMSFQNRYFSDLQNPFLSTSNINQFFQDRAAIERVAEIKEARHYVEHYLQVEPFGYLMLTESGSIGRVIIYDEEGVLESIETAKKYGAPSRIINKLENQDHIMVYWEDIASMNGEEYPWDEYIKPAEIVSGIQNWYIAEDANCPKPINFDADECSYDKLYKQKMDELMVSSGR